MDNSAYLLALQTIEGLGPLRLKLILDYFKDPKLAWEADAKTLQELKLSASLIENIINNRPKINPVEYLEQLQKQNIKWLTIYDENYPQALKQIHSAPVILYYKGEFLPEDERSIAIVGTRKVTGYGAAVTEKFTQGLVEAGFTIVSGLARGVDSAAHWAAIKAGGRTIAVLGSGLNNIYPAQNLGLAEKIINGFGAVVTEFPPENPSLPGNFPARNRIISGLSKAVVVTEADLESGSLITARLAIEHGREVFAVPGPITSQFSRGPVELIKEGATIVIEPQDILDELGVTRKQPVPAATLANLNSDEKSVLNSLVENKHIDELCRELKLSAALISGVLLKLEILGLVRNLGGGIYCKSL